jgi:hypothetical protein
MALHILHVALIVFCLFGWIYEPTRKANLFILIAVLFSWFGLGCFFGFGYCLITDIQWKIMRRLGKRPESGSYIKYLTDKITTLHITEITAERITAVLFFALLTVSVLFNLRT